MSSPPLSSPDFHAFAAYLRGLQSGIASQLNARSQTPMQTDAWQRPEGGGGRALFVEEGDLMERAAVNFSHVQGTQLPPTALANRPELTGRRWEATGLSLVLHPVNPFAPTIHMNLRLFLAHPKTPEEQAVWWFGGGIDLTPIYGFTEDAQHFHRGLKRVLDRFDPAHYPAFKAECDRYFYLKHRQEMRGVGGIFFDDVNTGDFAQSEALVRAVGDAFCGLYLPILDRRSKLAYTPEQQHWQSLRRARYIEFNLVYDRGTHFGLQSNGHINAILLSLPLRATWRYQDSKAYAEGSPEQALLRDYLQPKDWINDAAI